MSCTLVDNRKAATEPPYPSATDESPLPFFMNDHDLSSYSFGQEQGWIWTWNDTEV